MKAIVICPDREGALPFFSRTTPVALASMLGQSLLSQALTALAEAGAKDVTILAADRPEQVRRAVGHGERWGIAAHVVAESRELSVEEAREKYRPAGATDWLPQPHDVLVANGTPISGEAPLENARDWFASLRRFLPRACEQRVGVREIEPGVWVCLRARIEEGVRFEAPCWLGEGAWVRAGARVGPGAYIEDEVMIDHDAVVSESWIGPRTYVGALTQVHGSLAWGSGLFNYDSGSFLDVPDAFLLSELRPSHQSLVRGSLLGRLFALGFGLLTIPVALLAWLNSRRKNVAFCTKRRAVVPVSAGTLSNTREIEYSEFPGLSGLWRRWPQLWSIVRGDFAWIGNRPITREQSESLVSEFEQLWLAAPVGLVSLADAEGCDEIFDDEVRAHASFYAAQVGSKLNRQILRRLFRRKFLSFL